jgi:hypothetical protein
MASAEVMLGGGGSDAASELETEVRADGPMIDRAFCDYRIPVARLLLNGIAAARFSEIGSKQITDYSFGIITSLMRFTDNSYPFCHRCSREGGGRRWRASTSLTPRLPAVARPPRPLQSSSAAGTIDEVTSSLSAEPSESTAVALRPIPCSVACLRQMVVAATSSATACFLSPCPPPRLVVRAIPSCTSRARRPPNPRATPAPSSFPRPRRGRGGSPSWSPTRRAGCCPRPRSTSPRTVTAPSASRALPQGACGTPARHCAVTARR